MIEEEIAAQVTSLGKFMEKTLRHWNNWTFEYMEAEKDGLAQKMNEAFLEMKFQPPKKEYE